MQNEVTHSLRSPPSVGAIRMCLTSEVNVWAVWWPPLCCTGSSMQHPSALPARSRRYCNPSAVHFRWRLCSPLCSTSEWPWVSG